uniref:Global nitrogen transcriptional regulator n=1 Tax=Dipterocladia arabiensis TaxID=2007176 RepID=A0A1Z1M0Q7_9FLOR|nr:global nitrogen transcriptional regulator [Dipterocladia arabiensis]ARW59470.1 global nitrogen transcriptional regulator [Dipterocladia arabiensis]
MKWINNFSNLQISYYIYKLNKGDKIICNNKSNYDKSIIILYGITYLFKTLNNKQIFPLAILNKNNIIHLDKYHVNKKINYQLIAFETTYLISFSYKNITNKTHLNNNLLLKIITSQELTKKNYEIMINILKHKYIKYRIIQLLLLLSLKFGVINEKEIMIPFSLSQKNLAIITESNKITVNKIINELCKKMLIRYSAKKIIYITDIYMLKSILP